MKISRHALVTAGLLSAVCFMAMATAAKQDDPAFTNLKVLPKNITKEQLHSVMDNWSHSLKVRCSFCHQFNAETKKMDWASDAKSEKQIARSMFKMTDDINKKYFGAAKDSTGMVVATAVNCYTCHKGNPHPEVVDAAAAKPDRPNWAPPAPGSQPTTPPTPPTPPPTPETQTKP
ncbi:c-type cytochrome [Mucilaginibacter pallidiroseus]|uniref:Photosynthetic reaction center cytochrome c subunit n=1 Tax=Mucilaginibacter pallidiroseus TaxID=2599295 RepID=A0A563UJR9_9SPHI|nr:c-type cytochrome [Mucilaginibacter pallidiroseus]TWR31630.1 c-type cytochrome [Mucilaginibacter pallidiroseus]